MAIDTFVATPSVALSTLSTLFLTAMKAILPITLIFLTCLYHLDAFLPILQRTVAARQQRLVATPLRLDAQPKTTQTDSKMLTHADIVWKIRPPPDYPLWRRVYLRLAANALRLEALLKGTPLPTVLCPRGTQAVLYAVHNGKRIGRFGITTVPGPSASAIQETVAEFYGRDPRIAVRSSAIKYMVVEQDYRTRGVGALALAVIALIHAVQGADFTLLVADDKGSGRLVAWYERHGFRQAPKLQTLLGSPDGRYGITMMAPTCKQLPDECHIQWW